MFPARILKRTKPNYIFYIHKLFCQSYIVVDLKTYFVTGKNLGDIDIFFIFCFKCKQIMLL